MIRLHSNFHLPLALSHQPSHCFVFISQVKCPDRSFIRWDPGRLLNVYVDSDGQRQTNPTLSPIEQTAVAQVSIFSVIHKVKQVHDEKAGYRIKGQTISFPTNSADTLGTRTAVLPRTDVADLHQLIFSGNKRDFTARVAGILNARRFKFSYTDCEKILTSLQQTHPQYLSCRIARHDEINWEEQRKRLQQPSVSKPTAQEAAVASDIAQGWDTTSAAIQAKGSPLDADFGAVLCMEREGLTVDPRVATAKAAASLKETTATIKIHNDPVNEFNGFAELLSLAFPLCFPLGLTDLDFCSSGPMKKLQLERLLKFYDGRASKNDRLLLYLAQMFMRHRAISNITAKTKIDSGKDLVTYLNSEQYDIDCNAAAVNPKGTAGKILRTKIGPLIRLTGGKVPWGPLERLGAVSHLYAMHHTFGPPTFFVTFSPKVSSTTITPAWLTQLTYSRQIVHRC